MKISDCFICWTPDRPEFPAGFRGKCRLFPAGTAVADMKLFACAAGRFDDRAQDPRREVREAYVLEASFTMTERHGLDRASVNQLLLQVEEYESAVREMLDAQHSEEY